MVIGRIKHCIAYGDLQNLQVGRAHLIITEVLSSLRA